MMNNQVEIAQKLIAFEELRIRQSVELEQKRIAVCSIVNKKYKDLALRRLSQCNNPDEFIGRLAAGSPIEVAFRRANGVKV